MIPALAILTGSIGLVGLFAAPTRTLRTFGLCTFVLSTVTFWVALLGA